MTSRSSRGNRLRIDQAIAAALSSQSFDSDTLVSALLTHCDKSRLNIITGKDGAICPHCDRLLKNQITLKVHMTKCRARPLDETEEVNLSAIPPIVTTTGITEITQLSSTELGQPVLVTQGIYPECEVTVRFHHRTPSNSPCREGWNFLGSPSGGRSPSIGTVSV